MNGSVTLSSSEFKALASEKRAGIIKLLQERNHTLSEVSKKMGLAAPTVKQHLGTLQEAGLVQSLDEGRKWKYYTLTRKGRKIFSPQQPTNVLIVLGATLVAMLGMAYWFFQGITWFAAEQSFADNIVRIGEWKGTAAEETVVQGGEAAAGAPIEMAALFLGIVAAALLAGFLIGKLKGQKVSPA